MLMEFPVPPVVLGTLVAVLGTTSGQLVIAPAVFDHTIGVPSLSLGVVNTTARRLGSATGVLGTRLVVVATTAEPPGTTPGVLGIPPEVLDTAPGVLSSVTGVLGTPSGVLDTSSPVSPPPWMTRCSTTKVSVKPSASPVLRLL